MAMTAIVDAIQETPGLRVNNEPDDDDDARALWAWERFKAQDGAYRLRDRTIEENIRFLAGQHWWVYHHLLGWKDITYWMSDEEKRWRQRPVFNRILPWFILTHARMTENPFICSFLAGPDRKDAQLAEILDILHKTKWREMHMTDVWDRCAGWLIAAGAVFPQTRIDLNKGEWEKWIGKAELPLLGPDDQPVIDERTGGPILKMVNDVPFDENGEPLMVLRADGPQQTGEPHAERRGDLVVDVFSPLEVRGQWGPLPWHEQRIHMSRSFITPEEVYDRWGIECEPDVRGEAASSAGFLERVLFGSGFYGAASSQIGSEFGVTGNAKEGYCAVQTTWMAPSKRIDGMQEGPDKPGGRMLVSTREKVLKDGPREIAFRYTSPIRNFEFLRIPGRAGGTTPEEMMKSPQRAMNTGWKQILENRALASNPQQVYDNRSGLKADQLDNRPGRQYGVRMRPGVEPIKWIVPPNMGSDVWRTQEALKEEMQYLGSTHGTQPSEFAKDASGELVRELRFNDDRFLGPTMRRAAEEHARMQYDWMAMYPTIYTVETVLKYTGEDNVARAITLMPDIFDTQTADIIPDLESMQPEGRGERKARIYKMWQDGWWGDPQSPEALRKAHELGNFPGIGRLSKPGGVHYTTAEQENGQLLQGVMPPVYEWYEDQIHLVVLEEFMSTPEWRRLDDEIRLGFVLHRQDHQMSLAKKEAQAMQKAVEQAVMMAKAEAAGDQEPKPAPAKKPAKAAA
ncbi:hypothetical protein LCGC14_1446660 [marine sediment metagenome]|uniref:Uncharacterized protein n=1 Tax=marine sediment metagenome TaxID=412755 RepID=A0A0F9MKY6_9ZZZZ